MVGGNSLSPMSRYSGLRPESCSLLDKIKGTPSPRKASAASRLSSGIPGTSLGYRRHLLFARHFLFLSHLLVTRAFVSQKIDFMRHKILCLYYMSVKKSLFPQQCWEPLEKPRAPNVYRYQVLKPWARCFLPKQKEYGVQWASVFQKNRWMWSDWILAGQITNPRPE